VSIRRLAGHILLFLLVTATAAFAQAVSEVQGTVQDSTGAVLPGVDVKMTNTDTGLLRTAVTGPDGGYLLPALPPGPYRLEATLQGFRNYVQNGIVLQVGVNPRIVVTLDVGTVADAVTVTANAPLVETQSTAIGRVVEQQRIEQLPLGNRDITQLITFTAGAAVDGRTTRGNYGTGAAGSYGATAFPSLAGGITGSVAFSLDGGTHNDPLNNGNLPLPFPDAIREFKVETSSLDAQYGYHSSGAVNVVTRSGTNAFHGDAFEFGRNSKFNAQQAFTTVKPPNHRNQFGATIGGPLVKDKLFYFGAYQGTIQDQVDPLTATVPTAAMLGGDFSTVMSSACRATGQLNLPATLGFTGNRIDPSRLNPIAVNFAKTYLPVNQADQCGLVSYQGHVPGNNPTEHQLVAKVDYQMTMAQSLFVRVFKTRLTLPTGDPSENPLFLPTTGQDNNVFSSVFGHTLVLSPRAISQFRATYNKNVQDIVVPSYFNWHTLGINNIDIAGSPDYIGGLNVTGAFTFGSTVSRQPYETYQVSEDMSTTLRGGAHQLNYGVNAIYLKAEALNQLNRNGSFTFGGQRSGAALVDFMLGLPSSFGQAAPVPSYQTETVFGAYVQDIWRAQRNLTVNLGIRWDPMIGHGAPGDDTAFYFSESALIAGTKSKVYPNAPAGLLFVGDPGGPTNNRYFATQMWNFSPRLGIAWDPRGDGRTVIRTSYGLLHEIPSFAFDQFGFAPPLGISITRNFPQDTPSFDDPWRGYPGGNPFPGAFTPGHNAIWLPNAQALSYPPDLHSPYVQQWNVAFEKQVRNWLLSATYLGNQSTHLWNDTNPNPTVPIRIGTTAANSVVVRRLTLLNPTAGALYGPSGVVDDGSTAKYNGVVLSARGRFGSLLDATTNFTYAKCTSDPTSLALGLAALQQSNPYDRSFDRGNCPSFRDKVINFTLLSAVPRLSSPMRQMILGNWRGALSGRIQSGQWFNATNGVDQALTATSTQRPNEVGTVYAADPNAEQWLNPAGFALPALGTFGDEPVNDLLGPSSVQLDLAVSRVFRIVTRHQLEIRVEAFNLFNVVNLANPIAAINNPNFGKIHVGATGTAAGTLGQPRTMQFAVRYTF
jgi:hypothetical protein